MSWSTFLNPNYFVYFSIAGLLSCTMREMFKINSLAKAEIAIAPEKVLEIARMIKKGSMAYLIRQLKVLVIVKLIIASILAYFINVQISIAFLFGAILSYMCAFLSMYISVSANYKVTLLSNLGLEEAFEGAFSVGKCVGYLVSGVALSTSFMAYQYAAYYNADLIQILIGLSFGSSLISMFARVAGGIFTKGADIGADLVGKIEQNIPEDDPRNPAVIADNVGDNVGDCAGMAADLFESYIVIISAAIAITGFLFNYGQEAMLMPFTILASGAIGSIITLETGWNINSNTKLASQNITIKTIFLSSLITSLYLSWYLSSFVVIDNNIVMLRLIICTLIGTILGPLMMPITEYYTSSNFSPVQTIEQASEQGHAPNIIQGIAVGLKSCFLPLMLISASILTCIYLIGIYGVALACVGMISTCTVILALDAFGPVTDNAGGIAQMSNMNKKIRNVTDELDAMGNVTKAATKGYAAFSAALATIVMINAYKMDLIRLFQREDFIMDIGSGYVIAGLFMGAAIIIWFAGKTLLAVNKASAAIIEEVRSQFKTMPGIMNNTQEPLYERAIDILTKASLKEMILPGLMPILIILISFFSVKQICGIENAFQTLGGLITGATVVGIFIAFSMTTSGGAWDNAKKAIEAKDKKGSPEHQAAVTGDTVGDPYKDTTGPSINPMIKLISITALLLIMAS